MRVIRFAAIASLVALLGGCPDKDKHASIEAMNKGIQAFSDSNVAEAIKSFKDAVGRYPDNHQAWYSLGQVYGKKGEWDKAAEAFEEAAKRRDDGMYSQMAGLARYEMGDAKDAVGHLEKAVKLNGELYNAYWYLGRAYRDTGEPKKAAEAWSRSVTLNPYFGAPFVALGNLYLVWDMVPQAISVLEQGKKTVKDPKERADVFYNLGLAYDAQQKWDKAIEAYQESVKLASNNAAGHFQLGLALGKAGEKEKAIKELEEFLAMAGDDHFNIQQARKHINILLFADEGKPVGLP